MSVFKYLDKLREELKQMVNPLKVNQFETIEQKYRSEKLNFEEELKVVEERTRILKEMIKKNAKDIGDIIEQNSRAKTTEVILLKRNLKSLK